MDKILSLLGLANRANKLYFGENCLDNMSFVKYLIIANDISPKQNERYIKKTTYYNIPYINRYSSEQISNALGKNLVKAVGINDTGFAKTIDKYLKEEKDGETNI